MSKRPGMPTEQPPEVDVDEEGSPLQPEEGILRSPVAGAGQKKAEEPAHREEAAQCEDVFCETKTVDESSLMKLSEADRVEQMKRIGAGSAAGGR